MERIFLEHSAKKLRQLEGRIQTCLEKLSADQIWMREAETQNAVGNLVLHLCGNVRQWIYAGIGGHPDTRERDEEFAARGEVPREELKQRLAATVNQAVGVLDLMPIGRLAERVQIQKYDITVLEAVCHVVEHFSEHTGQIIFATKLFTREDLGFYGHLKVAAAHGQKVP